MTADLAGERLLAAVRHQVDPQVTGRLEALLTDAAAVKPVHGVELVHGVKPVHGVGPLVLAQLQDGAEQEAAAHARARNCCGVRLEMFA